MHSKSSQSDGSEMIRSYSTPCSTHLSSIALASECQLSCGTSRQERSACCARAQIRLSRNVCSWLETICTKQGWRGRRGTLICTLRRVYAPCFWPRKTLMKPTITNGMKGSKPLKPKSSIKMRKLRSSKARSSQKWS